MRRLTSIVAVNRDGVIGCGNALPWKVKSDLRFFKEQTYGNVVIMGRKTYESIGKPLPGRFNIVLTHQLGFFEQTENCKLAYSIGEALRLAEEAPKKYSCAFVVGGASTYEQFSPFVDEYIVTVIDKDVPNADAFFNPDLIGDLDKWESTALTNGFVIGDGDEAPYAIKRLKAVDAVDRCNLRVELVQREVVRLQAVRGKPAAKRTANPLPAMTPLFA